MKYLLFVALGGAFGSSARYLLATWVQGQWEGRWPLSTLLVNVLGSLAIGLLFVLIERQVLHPDWRGVLMVGFLGAFTTFSTFSLDALSLWQNGQLSLALAYILASVILCLLGMALAVVLTRLI